MTFINNYYKLCILTWRGIKINTVNYEYKKKLKINNTNYTSCDFKCSQGLINLFKLKNDSWIKIFIYFCIFSLIYE